MLVKGRGDLEAVASRSFLTNNGDIVFGRTATTQVLVRSSLETTVC